MVHIKSISLAFNTDPYYFDEVWGTHHTSASRSVPLELVLDQAFRFLGISRMDTLVSECVHLSICIHY